MNRLLDLLSGRRTVTPRWSYTPGTQVWRLVPSEYPCLVGEARNESEKSVTFFAIDLPGGAVRWEGKRVSEPWWVGVEAVHNGIVLLHLFARPDMPEHAGLVALDLGTGRELWSVRTYRFLGPDGADLLVTDTGSDDPDVLRVSPASGEILERIPRDGTTGERQGMRGDPEGIEFPSPVLPSDPAWAVLSGVAGRGRNIGQAEMAVVDDRQIFSYHASADTTGAPFGHHLVVVDSSGRRVYTDTLHEEARMPVYDAFFIREKDLYYVRREREVVCVPVGNMTAGS